MYLKFQPLSTKLSKSKRAFVVLQVDINLLTSTTPSDYAQTAFNNFQYKLFYLDISSASSIEMNLQDFRRLVLHSYYDLFSLCINNKTIDAVVIDCCAAYADLIIARDKYLYGLLTVVSGLAVCVKSKQML